MESVNLGPYPTGTPEDKGVLLLTNTSNELQHFEDDRKVLQKALDALEDPAVSLSEWEADNVFGDPHLGPAMRTVNSAVGALHAAGALLRLALDQVAQADAAEGYTDLADLLQWGIASSPHSPGKVVVTTEQVLAALRGAAKHLTADDVPEVDVPGSDVIPEEDPTPEWTL